MQTIIALDYSSKEEVVKLLKCFNNEKLFLKVGMELFFSEGLDIVKYLKDLGHNVFLDLKLNDISNTVAKGASNLAKLEVDILSIHSLGGKNMLKACYEAISECKHKPMLFGISVLTSFDKSDLEEIGIKKDIKEYMLDRALAMRECGFSGSVCSVWESKFLKENVGDGFMSLCPGIRVFSGSDDQKRVATYNDALENLADFVVIGREITKSDNPKLAYEKILNYQKQ